MEKFKIKCLECGSENIFITGSQDNSVLLSCQDCENAEIEE